MDFVKKEWQFRDIISENELNRMEDGIEEGITKAEQAQQTANEAKATADAAQSDISAHISATTGVHGATSAATPNTIVQRDANGRFKAAAPSASDDVARKAEVDAKVSKSGDTMTGTLTIQGGQFIQKHSRPQHVLISTATNEGVRTEYREDQKRLRWQSTDGNGAFVGQLMYLDRETGELYLTPSEHKVWHAGNDGAGSGLDADMLDGRQPSTSATANTIVQRDSSGRIKAAAPSASDDVVRKAELDGHANRTDNPHGVTKAQVGLGNVQNYGIATQAQAEAGTANNVYMTPLRTKQAIDQFVSTETGTWTPNVEIGGVRASYASRSGTYIRIGNLLYWSFYIELSSKNNGTGAVAIGAFPFPLAPENGTIPMGKITNVGYFPQGTRWVYLHLPWNGATFFWLQAVSDVFTGDVSLTGYNLNDDSILAASGVCRIAG